MILNPGTKGVINSNRIEFYPSKHQTELLFSSSIGIDKTRFPAAICRAKQHTHIFLLLTKTTKDLRHDRKKLHPHPSEGQPTIPSSSTENSDSIQSISIVKLAMIPWVHQPTM